MPFSTFIPRHYLHDMMLSITQLNEIDYVKPKVVFPVNWRDKVDFNAEKNDLSLFLDLFMAVNQKRKIINLTKSTYLCPFQKCDIFLL
jgi:hypothetical protein